MSQKAEVVAAYNRHMLSPAAFQMLFDDDPSAAPNSLKPFFHDDAVLSEPESLPWGGLWHGLEGLIGEAKAFVGAFRGEYEFTPVSESEVQTGENEVYRSFELIISKRSDPTRKFTFRGVERYDFSGDKIAYLDVFYKDTAGLMQFIGVAA